MKAVLVLLLALMLAGCVGPIVDPIPRDIRPGAEEVPRPLQAVTRGELAAELSKALNLPPSPTDYFSDDDGTEFEDGINRAVAAGFAGGCTEERFCPDQVVSRGIMAEFLARGLELAKTDEDHFSDDDGTEWEPYINRIAEAGLVVGREEGGFGPTDPLLYGHMLAFLSRARRVSAP